MIFTRLTVVVAILLALPWLVLAALGGYWLWQQDWLYYGLGVISASVALAFVLLQWQQRNSKAVFVETIDIAADPNWSNLEQQAWQSLEAVSVRWLQQPNLLNSSTKILTLSNEVLTVVARHYHAESNYPILEFPLPYLLKLIVLVCDDLQQEVLDKIPGSHAVRVIDLLRAKQAADAFGKAKALFSVGNWLVNWPGAALGKARAVLLGKGLTRISQELSERLIRLYIQKLGYYAIQLYSGQISLEDCLSAESLTRYSQNDLSANQQQTTEPLRILLLGQVSSGKSSLINALFGQVKAAEGWLPTTAEITPYVLERDGLEQAIILDSAGYGGLAHPDALAALQREWIKTDVVLLVCKANQAAREADARQLDAIRDFFQNQCRNQTVPVILAVVTHIDQLRPLQEWQPPYNIQQPTNTKAQNIRLACETVAQELRLPLTQIVPVCLAPSHTAYNIEDGLLPVIHEHLDDAQRVKYLRCLRQQQKAGYWRKWRKQMGNLGQVILDWA